MTRSRTSRPPEAAGKNRLEWAVFALGCVLVLGTVAFLACDAWTGAGDRPDLDVRLGKAQRRGGHYAVPVEVVNRGGESAEEVHVEVVLEGADGRRERSDFRIAYLPRRSSRHGWVTFETDPAAAARVVARPVGYAAP